MCDENHALVSENAFLIDLKDKSEKKVQILETLVVEKEDRVKEISLSLKELKKISKCSIQVRHNWTKFCPKVSTLEINKD